MAATLRSTRPRALPPSEPKPLALWVTTEGKEPAPTDNQDAAAMQAIGLQLDAQSPTPHSSRAEATLTLKRRTVEFLFDPATGQTSWLHGFGLQDEIESVERSRPNAYVTLAKIDGGDTDTRTSVLSPSGRMARLEIEAGSRPASRTSPKAEAERDSLVGMLLSSGWTWRDADDTFDH